MKRSNEISSHESAGLGCWGPFKYDIREKGGVGAVSQILIFGRGESTKY